MAEEAAARELRRDGVLVEGPDARSWLQGQVSQDLEALAESDSRLTLVLSPQGKIESFCRVTRIGPEALLLDVEAGYGKPLYERLVRFKLRVKSTLEPVAVVATERAGGGYDSLGPPRVPADPGAGDEWGGAGEDVEVFEAARIAAGVPRLGRELTEATIPHEAGKAFIERTVSFTKGCYTGQELVARLDARGARVPRSLRIVRAAGAGGGLARPGDRLVSADEEVGALTSVARDGEGGIVALAFVKRAHLRDEPAKAELATEAGVLVATISPLPAAAPVQGG
jgi:folate-binding protein YgfZ